MAFGAGQTNLDKEKVDLLTTELLDYAEMVRRTVQTLQINGCWDTHISFEANALSAGYANSNSPADNSCHVFHPNGGGINYNAADSNIANDTEFYFLNNVEIGDIGTDGVSGNSDHDVVMVLTQMNEDICRAINTKFNIPEVGGTVPEDANDFVDSVFPSLFDGVHFLHLLEVVSLIAVRGLSNNCSVRSDNQFCGKMAGCFKEEDPPEYFIFYQVLVAR